ncbi:hypothetical protein PVK73_19025 [Bacillus thuringiensis]
MVNQKVSSNLNSSDPIQYFVMTSDSQYPWLDCTNAGGGPVNCSNSHYDSDGKHCQECPPTDPCSATDLKATALETVQDQYNSIVDYAKSVGTSKVSVIINGDITSYGHNDSYAPGGHEWDTMLGVFHNLQSNGLRYFFGLGNHDYINNTGTQGNCGNDGCFRDSIDHVYGLSNKSDQPFVPDRLNALDGNLLMSSYDVTLTGKNLDTRTGSFSYAVDVGDVRIVQLNAFPTAYVDSHSAGSFEVTSSSLISWLTKVLDYATAYNRPVLLNLHQTGDWTVHNSQTEEEAQAEKNFTEQIVKKYPIIAAVFAGHLHFTAGDLTNIAGERWVDKPVFLSGSVMNRSYLIVEDYATELKVYLVCGNDWRNKVLLRTISLPYRDPTVIVPGIGGCGPFWLIPNEYRAMNQVGTSIQFNLPLGMDPNKIEMRYKGGILGHPSIDGKYTGYFDEISIDCSGVFMFNGATNITYGPSPGPQEVATQSLENFTLYCDNNAFPIWSVDDGLYATRAQFNLPITLEILMQLDGNTVGSPNATGEFTGKFNAVLIRCSGGTNRTFNGGTINPPPSQPLQQVPTQQVSSQDIPCGNGDVVVWSAPVNQYASSVQFNTSTVDIHVWYKDQNLGSPNASGYFSGMFDKITAQCEGFLESKDFNGAIINPNNPSPSPDCNPDPECDPFIDGNCCNVFSTPKDLAQITQQVNGLFSSSAQTDLNLDVSSYHLDQVLQKVNALSSNVFGKERTLLRKGVNKAKKLLRARNLLVNGDFDMLDGWVLGEEATIGDNFLFKKTRSLFFSPSEKADAYAYQKIDESKLKPYTRYTVSGFVNNGRLLTLSIYRAGNEITKTLNTPLVHPIVVSSDSTIPYLNTDNNQVNSNFFSYSIDVGELHPESNPGIELSLSTPRHGFAEISNVAIMEERPLTEKERKKIEKKEKKQMQVISKERAAVNEVLQPMMSRIQSLFINRNINGMISPFVTYQQVYDITLPNLQSLPLRQWIKKDSNGKLYVILPVLQDALKRLKIHIEEENLIHNGNFDAPFASGSDDWVLTGDAHLIISESSTPESVLQLFNWDASASQAVDILDFDETKEYQLLVRAKGDGSVTIEHGEEVDPIIGISSEDFHFYSSKPFSFDAASFVLQLQSEGPEFIVDYVGIMEVPDEDTVIPIIRPTVTINGVSYNWMETSYGTNRGMTFNPGQHAYQIKPNPHDDPWYNKNQGKFYTQMANGVATKGNAGHWTKENWPDTITGVTVNGISYTLFAR